MLSIREVNNVNSPAAASKPEALQAPKVSRTPSRPFSQKAAKSPITPNLSQEQTPTVHIQRSKPVFENDAASEDSNHSRKIDPQAWLSELRNMGAVVTEPLSTVTRTTSSTSIASSQQAHTSFTRGGAPYSVRPSSMSKQKRPASLQRYVINIFDVIPP
jgi:hypothetical protein